MVHTFQTLTDLFAQHKFPRYILLITCEDEEKAVLYSNAERYLSHVECIVYTIAEQREFFENSVGRLKKLFVNKVIGQITTRKSQVNAAGLVAGWAPISLMPDELDSNTDLQILLSKARKEITSVQVYKTTHKLPKPEDLPREWRRSIKLFLTNYLINPLPKPPEEISLAA